MIKFKVGDKVVVKEGYKEAFKKGELKSDNVTFYKEIAKPIIERGFAIVDYVDSSDNTIGIRENGNEWWYDAKWFKKETESPGRKLPTFGKGERVELRKPIKDEIRKAWKKTSEEKGIFPYSLLGINIAVAKSAKLYVSKEMYEMLDKELIIEENADSQFMTNKLVTANDWIWAKEWLKLSCKKKESAKEVKGVVSEDGVMKVEKGALITYKEAEEMKEKERIEKELKDEKIRGDMVCKIGDQSVEICKLKTKLQAKDIDMEKFKEDKKAIEKYVTKLEDKTLELEDEVKEWKNKTKSWFDESKYAWSRFHEKNGEWAKEREQHNYWKSKIRELELNKELEGE